MSQEFEIRRNYQGLFWCLVFVCISIGGSAGMFFEGGATLVVSYLNISALIFLLAGLWLSRIGVITALGYMRNPDPKITIREDAISMPGMMGGSESSYQFQDIKSYNFFDNGELLVIELILNNGARVNIPKLNLKTSGEYTELQSIISDRLAGTATQT